MLNYFLSNKAVEDLSKIWDYTYDTWSENQADKYYNRLINFCKDISDNPKIGKNYNEIDPTILGYHAVANNKNSEMCIITNKQNGKFSDFSSGLLRSVSNDEVENRNDDSGVFQSISKKIVGLRNMCYLTNIVVL